MHMLTCTVNTIHGIILEGENIGEWAYLNQLESIISVNELHVYIAKTEDIFCSCLFSLFPFQNFPI